MGVLGDWEGDVVALQGLAHAGVVQEVVAHDHAVNRVQFVLALVCVHGGRVVADDALEPRENEGHRTVVLCATNGRPAQWTARGPRGPPVNTSAVKAVLTAQTALVGGGDRIVANWAVHLVLLSTSDRFRIHFFRLLH